MSDGSAPGPLRLKGSLPACLKGVLRCRDGVVPRNLGVELLGTLNCPPLLDKADRRRCRSCERQNNRKSYKVGHRANVSVLKFCEKLFRSLYSPGA